VSSSTKTEREVDMPLPPKRRRDHADRVSSRTRRQRADGALFRRDLRPLVLMMIPAALVLIIIDLAPAIIGVINSFRLLAFSTLEHWFSAPWLGLRNYREALDGGGGLSVSGLSATWHSLEYSILTTLLALVVGVLAALSVSRRTSSATPVLRALYLVPTALPLFTSSYLWYSILLPKTGLLDVFRHAVGLGNTPNRFLVGGHSFAALVGVDLWLAWGFIYLFALAGLQSIPRELYEAAEIDGATRVQKFRYITYPGIRKLLAVGAVLSTFGHYNDFTLPYILFGAAPPTGVAVLPTTSYAAAYSIYNFGLADALAVIGVIAIIIPVIVYIRYVFSGKAA
jgi:multiple sugar transport system permease protein